MEKSDASYPKIVMAPLDGATQPARVRALS